MNIFMNSLILLQIVMCVTSSKAFHRSSTVAPAYSLSTRYFWNKKQIIILHFKWSNSRCIHFGRSTARDRQIPGSISSSLAKLGWTGHDEKLSLVFRYELLITYYIFIVIKNLAENGKRKWRALYFSSLIIKILKVS